MDVKGQKVDDCGEMSGVEMEKQMIEGRGNKKTNIICGKQNAESF